jgi:hypothetical protein
MGFKGSFDDYHIRQERENYDAPSLPDEFLALSDDDWEKGDMATFLVLGPSATQGEESTVLLDSGFLRTPEILLRFGGVVNEAVVLIRRVRGHLEVVMTECEVD